MPVAGLAGRNPGGLCLPEPYAFPEADEGIDHLQGDGNPRAVQILLGHTKIERTVRYLGVDVEDALTLAEGTEI